MRRGCSPKGGSSRASVTSTSSSVHGVDTHDERVGLVDGAGPRRHARTAPHHAGPVRRARRGAGRHRPLPRARRRFTRRVSCTATSRPRTSMREDGGRIVLMDLGTGRDIGRGDGGVGLAGTPLYLAPEIFGGATASVQSDIYSLGVLLYHLVTGEYPVRAASFEPSNRRTAPARALRCAMRRPDLPARVRRRRSTAPSRASPSSDTRAPRSSNPRSCVPSKLRLRRRAWHRAIVWGLLRDRRHRCGARRDRPSSQWRQTQAPRSAPLRRRSARSRCCRSGTIPATRAQDYFADGMTDEIISTLGRLGSVNVISRTSTAQFKGHAVATGRPRRCPQIARALACRRRSSRARSRCCPAARRGGKQKVRITARLIAAGTDTQIWNQTFEAVADDVIALEGQVARAIADGIRLRLSPEQQGALAAGQQRPPDFEAFNLYLQGRASWNVRTKASLERSIELLPAGHRARSEVRGAARRARGRLHTARICTAGCRMPTRSRRRPTRRRKRSRSTTPLPKRTCRWGTCTTPRFEWDAAEASFRRAIQLNPGNVECPPLVRPAPLEARGVSAKRPLKSKGRGRSIRCRRCCRRNWPSFQFQQRQLRRGDRATRAGGAGPAEFRARPFHAGAGVCEGRALRSRTRGDGPRGGARRR